MKILIIRFSSFGDIVLTTPIIRAIKSKYPNAEIDFLVYNTFVEAISDNPYINKLIIFNKNNSKNKEYIIEIIKKLSEEKYDFVVDLHSKILSRIISFKLKKNNPNLVCMKYHKRKWWKSILVKMKLIHYNPDRPIVDGYFEAVKKLNVTKNDLRNTEKIKIDGDNLEFYVNDKVEKEIIDKYNLKNENYVVLAPGASKFTKKWTYYDELAENILNKYNGYKVYVVGGKEDYGVVRERENVIDLAGKISFKESGILMKYAQLVVANDSGPFHIARSYHVNIIVFFGPTSPKLFNFEEKTKLMYNEKCKPHSLYGDDKFPNKYKDCMTGIKIEKVIKEVEKILK